MADSIHEAILLNDIERIQYFLQNAVQDVNKKDVSGRTPLEYCAITKGISALIPGKNLSSSLTGACLNSLSPKLASIILYNYNNYYTEMMRDHNYYDDVYFIV